MNRGVLGLLSFVLVTAAIGAVGCSSTQEAVDRRMILPSGAATYQVDERQHFLMAAPVRSPLPSFPEGVSAPDGLHEVCVRFVVSEMGEVEQIEFPEATLGCGIPNFENIPFQNAVTKALSQWSFIGAAVCTFPEGVEKDERCEGDGVEVRAVPIRLMYVFSFSQTGGKKSVGEHRRAP